MPFPIDKDTLQSPGPCCDSRCLKEMPVYSRTAQGITGYWQLFDLMGSCIQFAHSFESWLQLSRCVATCTMCPNQCRRTWTWCHEALHHFAPYPSLSKLLLQVISVWQPNVHAPSDNLAP